MCGCQVISKHTEGRREKEKKKKEKNRRRRRRRRRTMMMMMMMKGRATDELGANLRRIEDLQCNQGGDSSVGRTKTKR